MPDSERLRGILRDVREGRDAVVLGAAPNNRRHIASILEKKFVYLAGDISEARSIRDAIENYSGKRVDLLVEREDPLIRRRIADKAALGARNAALGGLLDDESDGVVVTCAAAMDRHPIPERFAKARIRFERGKEYPFEETTAKLAHMGYRRTGAAEARGEYRLTGDTLEIFPINEAEPRRLEFFGDALEKICAFSAETRVSRDEVDRVVVEPATDILLTDEEAENALRAARRRLRGVFDAGKRDAFEKAFDAFERDRNGPLNAYMAPFAEKQTAGALAYAKNRVLIVDDWRMISDKLKMLRRAFLNRAEVMIEGETALEEQRRAIFDASKCLGFFDGNKLYFSSLAVGPRDVAHDRTHSLKTAPLPAFYADMPAFFRSARQMLRMRFEIFVFARDAEAKERLKKHFRENGIYPSDSRGPGRLVVETGGVERGFAYPLDGFMCVGIYDLERKVVPAPRVRRAHEFAIPAKGDFVVHEHYGIGMCDGMQRLKTVNCERDYLVLIYRGGDKLYLPVEQFDSIEKYGGADVPRLHALGGGEFERVKARVRESVRELAINLAEAYRNREGRKGYAYPPDTEAQKAFERDFEYPETEDQLKCIAEIKRDMESGKIMDRLICGDVGYGKTEVALRAIFKTVSEARQVAVLAPTTILARQHYNLIRSRMEPYGFSVELLCRLSGREEAARILERVRNGDCDVVVATHRILSPDAAFCDLGLLVLDEEQRFGVEQKEKIKAMKTDVNALSLSATPIPRTLHMALSGIRDISLIETPPKNRLPVETYVTEYSDGLLKDVATRELNRGGQAFILCNRIERIEKFFLRAKELLGERARVAYIHGAMPAARIEDAVVDFYAGKTNVLVSTTIIENGIDLPMANTLLVLDSDLLGLAQLYQLRGRVGRSETLAYAYFTVEPGKALTEAATKRLDAIMSNTSLGGGFRIAMQDLKIRGAGNVFGREQSGQMERVGYEMYLKLVREGIDEAMGSRPEARHEPELKISGNFALSEEYVPDQKARISLYRTVSTLSGLAEGDEFYARIAGLYGESERLRNVVLLGVLKNLARAAQIKAITLNSAACNLVFLDSRILADARFFASLEKFRDVASLSPTNPPAVSFRFDRRAPREKLRLLCEFVSDFAR